MFQSLAQRGFPAAECRMPVLQSSRILRPKLLLCIFGKGVDQDIRCWNDGTWNLLQLDFQTLLGFEAWPTFAILHARCPSKTYLNHVYHRVYPPAIRHPIKHGEMLRAYSWMMIQCFHMFPPSKVRMFQPFLQNLQKTREPSGLLQLRHTVRQKVRTTSRPVSSAKEQTWGFSDLIGFQYVQWENPWFPANEPLNFALNPSNDQFWNRKSIRTPRPWRLICNPACSCCRSLVLSEQQSHGVAKSQGHGWSPTYYVVTMNHQLGYKWLDMTSHKPSHMMSYVGH